MQIIVETPKTLETEREKLLNQAIETIKKQERSCARFALRLANIRNKIRAIEKKLGN